MVLMVGCLLGITGTVSKINNMSTKVKKIKDYFYYKSKEGVVSITSNTSTWHAIPSKKKRKVTKFKVDCTPKEIQEGDSPNIIKYKKKRGFFIPED